jgi:hypothetical protein
MKKVFVLAFAGVSILAACNDNQSSINDDSTERQDTSTVVTDAPPTTYSAYTPAEGDVSYRDKQVMVYRNGAWVRSDEDVKLDNGIVVYRTGVAKKDDKEVELEEGVVVNKEGDFFDRTGKAMENMWSDVKKGAGKVKEEAKEAVTDEEKEDDKK